MFLGRCAVELLGQDGRGNRRVAFRGTPLLVQGCAGLSVGAPGLRRRGVRPLGPVGNPSVHIPPPRCFPPLDVGTASVVHDSDEQLPGHGVFRIGFSDRRENVGKIHASPGRAGPWASEERTTTRRAEICGSLSLENPPAGAPVQDRRRGCGSAGVGIHRPWRTGLVRACGKEGRLSPSARPSPRAGPRRRIRPRRDVPKPARPRAGWCRPCVPSWRCPRLFRSRCAG